VGTGRGVACETQLKRPWDRSRDRGEQPRYARNAACELWDVFLGDNDWRVCDLVGDDCDDDGEGDPDRDDCELVLQQHVQALAAQAEPGATAAIDAGDDADADGYYVVQLTSAAYSLDEDIVLADFTPQITVPAGELLLDGVYFNLVPRARQWYTPSAIAVKFPATRLLRVGLELETEGVQLPRSCNVASARKAKAAHVSDADHEKIMTVLHRRDNM
jgi:hypothetical protein